MERKNPNKICSHCKKEKPISDFIIYKRGNRQGGIGVSSRCKICNKEYNKIWSKSDKAILNKRKYHSALKYEVFKFYSNGDIKCTCCGEKELMFLAIDHINNDGAKDRKITGSGGQFYRWLKKNDFPNKDKYQILCFNCNQGRQINKGICPHNK